MDFLYSFSFRHFLSVILQVADAQYLVYCFRRTFSKFVETMLREENVVYVQEKSNFQICTAFILLYKAVVYLKICL